MQDRARPDPRAGADRDMRADAGAGAQPHAGADNRERPDGGAVADLGRWVDDHGGMEPRRDVRAGIEERGHACHRVARAGREDRGLKPESGRVSAVPEDGRARPALAEPFRISLGHCHREIARPRRGGLGGPRDADCAVAHQTRAERVGDAAKIVTGPHVAISTRRCRPPPAARPRDAAGRPPRRAARRGPARPARRHRRGSAARPSRR